MKIKWQGYLGKNHSWAVTAQNLSRALIQKGHQVDLVTTDGQDHLPEDLRSHLQPGPVGQYDCQLSYTAPVNFPNYLNSGSKNRFGIWCYEFAGKNIIPDGFAKHYKNCDLIVPPSKFAHDILRDSGVPESSMKVIPHGVDLARFSPSDSRILESKGKLRILANIAQPHIRKNLPGLLEAYGKAFTSRDNVCLVLKVVRKNPQMSFEVSFDRIYSEFKQRFKNHAEVKVMTEFVEDIGALYRSCHVLFTMTHSECFFYPGLEALAAEMLVISPRWGGQLDFLSDQNAIMIEGREDTAPREAMYWQPKPGARYFYPSVEDAVDKLRMVEKNYQQLHEKFNPINKELVKQYSWSLIADQFMDLVK